MTLVDVATVQLIGAICAAILATAVSVAFGGRTVAIITFSFTAGMFASLLLVLIAVALKTLAGGG